MRLSLRGLRFALLVMPVAGCRATDAGAGAAGASGAVTVTLAGSTSLQPLAERWAEALAHADARAPQPMRLVVQSGGSTAGIRAVRDGAVDIGMSSRPLTAAEADGLEQTVVAIDGLAVVVHPENPVQALTRAQVQALFSGAVRSWRAVGGADGLVVVLSREEGSGTRATFDELVLDTARLDDRALITAFSGTVRRTVADDRRAIGYMTLSQVGPGVRPLAVDGVLPDDAAIATGRYPLHRPLFFLTRRDASPAARALLTWVRSAPGLAVVRAMKFVAPPPEPPAS
ncbi:MAG: phosphate ABC transporter substrate-binding protein [Gemmatimonadetes bacterium]|nr:phosphate ABC transporter substrate-binding protein [Gemmatimonadota bacterium]